MQTMPATVDRNVEYDDTVTRLKLDSYVTTAGRHHRYGQVCAAEWGGRIEHGGPIYAEPFAMLIQCAAVMSACGNGMAEFRDVPHLEDGDRVFVEHYGFHVVRIERGHASLERERDGFASTS